MVKMKKMIGVLMALVMILSLTACSSEKKAANTNSSDTTTGTSAAEKTDKNATESKKSLKIGFSLPSLNFPFYVRMYDTIVSECEARGWDVSFVDGNLDAGTQMNGCQDLVNQGIDVLIMATWWIDAMADTFAMCEQAGIPVFLMDNMTIPEESKNAITFTTGTDNYNAGAVGGTWCAEYLKSIGKTDLNLIFSLKTTETSIKRCYGFRDALIENGITVNVLNEYDAGEREKAMKAIEDALTAYDTIDMIYGYSAQDALGAFDACAGANRNEVMIFGFDGEDEELKNIDADTNYLATITQDPAGMAKLVTQKIDEHVLQGKNIEQTQETSAGVYGPDGQVSGEEIMK